PRIGVVVVRTEGDPRAILEVDRALHENREHWLANEILLLQARVLRRMDLTSKSFFALIEKDTCFAGSLFELALASDRIYMLADDDEEVSIALSPLNAGSYPMSHGKSRLEVRFLDDPEQLERVLSRQGSLIPTEEADELGLVTV